MQAVVDGDLCEMFSALHTVRQGTLASDLSRQTTDVFRKLEDVRNRIL